jgi:hypothetical protein
MTNVKLVTPYTPVVLERLRKMPVRVIDARKLTIEQILKRVFHPYSGRVVILTAPGVALGPGDLPVPEYVFQLHPLLGGHQLEEFVLNNYGLRTHSNDNKTFYDVYMVWYLCRHLPPVRVTVAKMLQQNYGTTDVAKAAPWDGEKIGEMMRSDPEMIRIMSTDLSFPVIVRTDFKLVDGHHRLVRAAIEKKRYIHAIVIDNRRLGMAWIEGINSIDDVRTIYVARFQ